MRNSMRDIVFIFTMMLLASCGGKKTKVEPVAIENIDTVTYQPEMRYGINIDSLDIEHKRVRRNEFLGAILEHEGISSKEVYTISKKYRDVFDVRKVRVGGNYELFHTRVSVPELTTDCHREYSIIPATSFSRTLISFNQVLATTSSPVKS